MMKCWRQNRVIIRLKGVCSRVGYDFHSPMGNDYIISELKCCAIFRPRVYRSDIRT